MEASVRRVLVLVSVIALVDVCFFSAITPLLPTYVDQLDLTKSQAGILSGSYALGTMLASLPGGYLAARWGARPTLLLGLALLGASSVAFGLGGTFEVLATARFAQGVGGAASWAAGLAWLVEVAPRERRGQLIGIALGAGIAGAIGGPVLGALAQALDPAAVFSGVAVVAAVLAVGVVTGPPGGAAPPTGGLVRALRNRQVQAGAWLTTVAALFFGTFGVLVPLRLDDLGVAAVGVAAVFLGAAAVEAAVSPLVGRLSDRRGRLLPLRVGLAGVVLACLLLPLPGAAWLLVAVVVVAAGAAGTLWAPSSALLADGADRVGLAQGVGFGLSNLAWAGGQFLGSAGGARLADATSDAVPYLTLAAVAAGTLAVLSPRRSGRRRGDRPVGTGPSSGAPSSGEQAAGASAITRRP